MDGAVQGFLGPARGGGIFYNIKVVFSTHALEVAHRKDWNYLWWIFWLPV